MNHITSIKIKAKIFNTIKESTNEHGSINSHFRDITIPIYAYGIGMQFQYMVNVFDEIQKDKLILIGNYTPISHIMN